MSRRGNGQAGPYDVRMSALTRGVVRRLHRQALQAGTGHRFLAAFREIIGRLHNDPLTFGEPIYRLPVLELLVRHAVLLPIVVDYAVHEDRPLVFVRGFKVLS